MCLTCKLNLGGHMVAVASILRPHHSLRRYLRRSPHLRPEGCQSNCVHDSQFRLHPWVDETAHCLFQTEQEELEKSNCQILDKSRKNVRKKSIMFIGFTNT